MQLITDQNCGYFNQTVVFITWQYYTKCKSRQQFIKNLNATNNDDRRRSAINNQLDVIVQIGVSNLKRRKNINLMLSIVMESIVETLS